MMLFGAFWNFCVFVANQIFCDFATIVLFFLFLVLCCIFPIFGFDIRINNIFLIWFQFFITNSTFNAL